MWKNVVPLKVSPKQLFLAYPAVRPVNQSLVTITAGTIPKLHNNSREAFPIRLICLKVSAAEKSG